LLLVGAAASADELRDSSIELGRWLADEVCSLPRPRVAVLLSGLVRTLHMPHVHRSIAHYAIDALGAETQTFADLKVNGTGRLGIESGADVGAALRYLRPAKVRLDHPDSELNARVFKCHGTLPERTAPMHWIASQWLSVKSAFELMVEYEYERSMRFDAVLRLRTDDVWLAATPPWCTFASLWASERVAYAQLAGSDRQDYVGGLDWWIFVPRSIAEPVFTHVDEYTTACTKSKPVHSEKWLAATLRREKIKLVRLQDMPRVIVYPHKDTARKFCKYVPAYLQMDGLCSKLRYPPHAKFDGQTPR